MNKAICPFYVAVLAALAGLFGTASAWAQSSEVPTSCRIENGTYLLADFLAVEMPQAAASEAGSAPAPQNLEPEKIPTPLLEALSRDHADVEFLVATVPEPRLGFDGVVESIARALEAASYTLDRYALPFAQRESKSPVACQEHLPGVALFVSPKNPSTHERHLLLVYFIGESPTAGIYRPAFLRAAEEMALLRRQLPAERCRNCTQVNLLGPAFSGGAASLEQLLEHPLVANLPFTILSGRATDNAIQGLLEGHGRKNRQVSFHATMIPDDALQTEFFCYLTETMGADDHDIAVLSESSTVFGQAAARTSGMEAAAHSVKLHKSVRCRFPHAPRLTIPVPLHVARVNAAWAEHHMSTRKGGDPHDSDTPKRLDRALPKPMVESSERTDIIPTLSASTVISTDRSLATLLTTIAAEKIRYLGLIFTDEQDTLFLAEEIRKFCPDVVLFTFENRILYTHPDVRPILKGMLSVSTYPLFTRNQQWSYPFQGYSHRVQFARDSDQGVYNATVALLGRSDLFIEYSQPITEENTLPLPRPPIWISAVGIETIVPLAFITDYQDHRYVFENPHTAPAQHLYAPYQQGTLNALLIVLGVVGVALAACYFRSYYAAPNTELRFPWALFPLFRRYAVTPASPAGAAREAASQPFFALAIFLPMALLYPLFTTVHFVQLRDGNSGLESGMALGKLPLWLRILDHSNHIGVYQGLTLRVLAIGLCAAACQIVFMLTSADLLLHCLRRGQRLRRWLRRKWHKQPYGMLLLAVALFVIAVFLVFRTYVAVVNGLQHDFNNLVFMRRAAHPGFGLSPLTPLLILISALQLWGYCNLARIRLVQKMAVFFFDFIEDIEHELQMRRQLERITQQMASPSLAEYAAAALATIALMGGLFSDVISLERYSVNLIFRLIFALLCVSVCYSAYGFLRLWLRFSRFLELFEHHPLVSALERIPEALARSIGSLFLEDLPEHARDVAEHSHLRLLGNQLSHLDLDKALGTLPSAEAATVRPLFAELQKLLAPDFTAGAAPTESASVMSVSRVLVQILKVFWRTRPLPGTLPEASGVAPKHSTAEVYEHTLPANIALWLRLGEDLVAIQVVAYIHRLFPLLRNMLLFFSGALLLLLAAIITYPFQPQHFLMLVLWTLILGTVGPAVVVFFQMNRNGTLSRIAKTEPGKFSLDQRFFSQVVIYGVLPLLSLLAAQFPEVRGIAFSWVESILKTLK